MRITKSLTGTDDSLLVDIRAENAFKGLGGPNVISRPFIYLLSICREAYGVGAFCIFHMKRYKGYRGTGVVIYSRGSMNRDISLTSTRVSREAPVEARLYG